MRSFITALLAVPAVLAAPVLLETRQEDNIAGSWIVRIQDDAVVADVVSQVTQLTGGSAKHTYEIGSFKGFSVNGVSDLASLVSNIASIQSIEPDTVVRTSALVTQNNVPSYGLARISHRNNGPNTQYIYDDSAGAGTFAYIIDTGIRTSHQDFGGRAQFGASFVDGETPDFDGNGHGTHVAGTTGSTSYGVAKKTTLIAVKVLGAEGSGSNAGVLAGIDWAVKDAKAKGRIGKAVANLSLGGPFSPMSNQAVTEAVRQGLFLAVAAGNSGLPTITSSPASAPDVCTIGASDKNDARASYSNFGLLVDVFAPGTNITSTWKDSDTDTNTISGTSMATPHITGLGAYLLALEGKRDPKALCKRIQDLSTKGKLNLGLQLLSANRLAYNGNGA